MCSDFQIWPYTLLSRKKLELTSRNNFNCDIEEMKGEKINIQT